MPTPEGLLRTLSVQQPVTQTGLLPSEGLVKVINENSKAAVDKSGDTMTGGLAVQQFLTVRGDSNQAAIFIEREAGTFGYIRWSDDETPRWDLSFHETADHLSFNRYNSSGVFQDVPFQLRVAGTVHSDGIDNATTADPANVVIGANGQLMRSTSSGRIKIERKPVETPMDVVRALNPMIFRSTVDNRNYAGFVEEEVAMALPEAAARDNYDIRAIVAVLTAAVQEQAKVIEDLQARVEDLETTRGTP